MPLIVKSARGSTLTISSIQHRTTTDFVKHLAFWSSKGGKWLGDIPPCDVLLDEHADIALAGAFRAVLALKTPFERLDLLAKLITDEPMGRWWKSEDVNHYRNVLCRWWLALYDATYGAQS